jgi:hypothetical protein
MKTKAVFLVLVVGLVLAASACGGGKKAAATTTRPTNDLIAAQPQGALAQIAVARRSSTLFAIFPSRVASVQCDIPHGGTITTQPMRGTCSTRILFDRGGRATVSFTERWRASDNAPAVFHRHTWHLTVNVAAGKVIGTRTTGTVAPSSGARTQPKRRGPPRRLSGPSVWRHSRTLAQPSARSLSRDYSMMNTATIADWRGASVSRKNAIPSSIA